MDAIIDYNDNQLVTSLCVIVECSNMNIPKTSKETICVKESYILLIATEPSAKVGRNIEKPTITVDSN